MNKLITFIFCILMIVVVVNLVSRAMDREQEMQHNQDHEYCVEAEEFNNVDLDC